MHDFYFSDLFIMPHCLLYDFCETILKDLEKKWQPIPMFFPGESHGQRSLAGYTLWGRRSWTRLSDQITTTTTTTLKG